ncbi:MAG: hypothetical protein ACPGUV_01385 [Polyangiales bacterium]
MGLAERVAVRGWLLSSLLAVLVASLVRADAGALAAACGSLLGGLNLVYFAWLHRALRRGRMRQVAVLMLLGAAKWALLGLLLWWALVRLHFDALGVVLGLSTAVVAVFVWALQSRRAPAGAPKLW